MAVNISMWTVDTLHSLQQYNPTLKTKWRVYTERAKFFTIILFPGYKQWTQRLKKYNQLFGSIFGTRLDQ